MKVIAFAFICIAFLFSCAGVENRYLESLDDRQMQEVQDLDLALFDYSVSRDKGILDRTEKQVTRLLQSDMPNKEYKAELLGLLGLVQYYKSDIKASAQTADLIERESTAECRLYLIRALLIKEPGKQIAFVIKYLPKAREKGLLQLFLAERYFDAGQYRLALASYDEALPSLHKRYREHYQNKRDLAFRFIDEPPVKTDTRDIIAKSELSFEDILTLTLRETHFLDTVTADKQTPVRTLVPRLQAKGFIKDDTMELSRPAQRRDVAYLLLRILSILENDPSLPDKYSAAVMSGTPSPVPDVSTSDYFYSAVLVVVEREILDLPDGIHFYPAKSISGGEFFDVLKKLKTRYGR